MSGCVAGVAHLHKMGIVHRDIKPANILIAMTAQSPRVVLADLGWATKAADGMKLTPGAVTPAYRAPEILMDIPSQPYSFPVDIWAIGIIAQELATCQDALLLI